MMNMMNANAINPESLIQSSMMFSNNTYIKVLGMLYMILKVLNSKYDFIKKILKYFDYDFDSDSKNSKKFLIIDAKMDNISNDNQTLILSVFDRLSKIDNRSSSSVIYKDKKFHLRPNEKVKTIFDKNVLEIEYAVNKVQNQKKSYNDQNEDTYTNYDVLKIYADKIDIIQNFLDFCMQERNKNIKIVHKNIVLFNKNSNSLCFVKHKHNLQKNFDSIFINQKELLMNHIDDFKNNRINKLSLLLHGPPGTGKTSIIKALANELDRSIVYVKLSQVRTLDDLLLLFYSNTYAISTSGLNYTIENHRKLIVFEDIDCECDAVLKRSVLEKKKNEEKIKKIESNNEDKANNSYVGYNNSSNKDTTVSLSDILQAFDGILEPR
jgi:predicted AAA+ superfamily ATPase